MKITSKNMLRFITKVVVLILISIPSGVLWSYTFYSLWGINAHYLPTLYSSFFEGFCPSQTVGMLDMPTRHEVLQEIVHIRENALWTLDVCLRGWALDSHREMIDPDFYLAVARRINMSFSFATLSTFPQWLHIIFEHLQPINPIWSTWYTVNAGYLYGVDSIEYQDYIREGAKILAKIIFMPKEPLSAEESDKLMEVLVYVAVAFSKSAENPKLDQLLKDIDDPWML